jgi:hypothetical protein
MTILKDPVRPFVPLTQHDQVGTTSFELSSRGGYVRTVTGTIAYLDEEAEAYMVLGDGDELLRVPLRDITSMREDPMNGSDRPGSRRDAEGLGTGQ